MRLSYPFLAPIICLSIFISASAFAVEVPTDADKKDAENFEYQTVTTKEGLSFRVPEDMPIQKKDGIVAPIPFDEYIFGKFKKMDLRLERIEAKLDKIEKLLEETKQSQPKVLKAGS